MTNISITGLPAIAWGVGIIVVGSVPVWFGAKITGAGRPTLLRSALSLLVGILGSIVGIVVCGPLAFLIVPLSFLCAFKFILDMSFFGALMLGIISLVGYFLMAKFIGGGFSVKEDVNDQPKPEQPVVFLEAPSCGYIGREILAGCERRMLG